MNTNLKRYLSVTICILLLATSISISGSGDSFLKSSKVYANEVQAQTPETPTPEEAVTTVPNNEVTDSTSEALVSGQDADAGAVQQEPNAQLQTPLQDNANADAQTSGEAVLEKEVKHKRIKELVEKRGLYSKHYLNDDGSITAEIYSEPVHFINEKGEYEDIDLNVSQKGKGKSSHSVEKNNFESYFDFQDSEDSQNAKFAGIETKNKNGDTRWINYELVGASPKNKHSNGNKYIFEEARDNVNLEYTVLSSSLKEAIVIKNPIKNTSFTFIIDKSDGVDLKSEGGRIYFVDSETNEILWQIEKPYAEDSAHNRTDNLSYNVGSTSYKGKTYDTVTLSFEDQAFLDNAVYPVTIDPTTSVPTNSFFQAVKFSSSVWPLNTQTETSNSGYATHKSYDTSYRQYSVVASLFKFDTSSIPAGVIVTSALISENRCNGYTDENRSVCVDWYTGSFDATAYTESSSGSSQAILSGLNSISITLSNANMNINRNGYTTVRATISGGKPSAYNYIELSEPQLTIVYTNAPTIALSSPASGQFYSAQSGKSAMSLSGTICDSNSGDVETVYYRIDGSTGQAGTKYGNTITSNAGNQAFPQPSSQTIDVSSASEGSHTVYAWAIDNGGAKSAEASALFKIDKTVPVANAPTAAADSTTQITVQPSASDPVANGVSSGLNSSGAYQFNRNGTDIGTWQNGSFADTGLSPNTLYTYKYKAMDNVLNTSVNSPVLSIYSLAEKPSTSVYNITAHSVDIGVTDNNPTSTEYQIICGTNYVTSTGVLTTVPTWITMSNKKTTLTGLNTSTLYSFQAKARNGNGIESGLSTSVNTTTLDANNIIPTNLTATSADTSITLNWNAVSGATGYDVLVDGTNTVDNGTNTSYTHNGLSANTKHAYKVRARFGGTAEGWSLELIKYTSITISRNVSSSIGSTFIFNIKAQNVQSFDFRSIKVQYNTNELDVLDLCAASPMIDFTASNITGTGISIVQFTPGTIILTFERPVAQGKLWCGVIDGITFKSKINGQSTVSYTVQ